LKAITHRETEMMTEKFHFQNFNRNSMVSPVGKVTFVLYHSSSNIFSKMAIVFIMQIFTPRFKQLNGIVIAMELWDEVVCWYQY